MRSETFCFRNFRLAGTIRADFLIRSTFVPIAFALAPSESSTATHLLLQTTDGHLQEKWGFTLKYATMVHLDGGTGLVKAFQDCFGPALPLASFSQNLGAHREEYQEGK